MRAQTDRQTDRDDRGDPKSVPCYTIAMGQIIKAAPVLWLTVYNVTVPPTLAATGDDNNLLIKESTCYLLQPHILIPDKNYLHLNSIKVSTSRN